MLSHSKHGGSQSKVNHHPVWDHVKNELGVLFVGF